ncbi:MAG: hypothetical protein AAFX99_24350, partial [Myxococcota bacterium]
MFRSTQTQWVLGVLALSLATSLVACGDDESSDPEARLVFAHNVSTLGEAEVLVDGEVATTVSAGELSNEIRAGLGTVTVAIRAQGASADVSMGSVSLAEQTYLVAFSDNDAPFVVDQTPPEAQAGKHDVEVVNIRTDDLALDVFAGTVNSAPPPLFNALWSVIKSLSPS